MDTTFNLKTLVPFHYRLPMDKSNQQLFLHCQEDKDSKPQPESVPLFPKQYQTGRLL